MSTSKVQDNYTSDVNLHSAQLRAGRALLRWDQKTLAKAAGVSVETIKRLESLSGYLSTRGNTVECLSKALESNGVVLLHRPNIGVALHVAAAVPSVIAGRRVVVLHTSPDEPAVALPLDLVRAEADEIEKTGNGGWAEALRRAADEAEKLPLDPIS